MNYKLTFIFFVFIMFVSNNCTFYSFKGTLPDNVNSISVPPIINGTSDYKFFLFPQSQKCCSSTMNLSISEKAD